LEVVRNKNLERNLEKENPRNIQAMKLELIFLFYIPTQFNFDQYEELFQMSR